MNNNPPNPSSINNVNNININFEEKYKDQLLKLEEMGFTDKQKNLEALKATNGNVEVAIERMMNNI